MPITLYPPLPFSPARFSEHIDFLRSVTGQIVDGALADGVRPLAANVDLQLASLARYHGERIYRDLAGCEGGAHEPHFQRLRRWALGENADMLAFKETLDHFERELTDPHGRFEREIRQTAAASSLPTRLLDFLKGECAIDHGNRVFHVNGVAVDPLLDQEPLPEVFSFLETVTDRGSRFTIPSLGLAVSADPTSAVSDLNDLLARLEAGTVAGLLLEEVLYVVSKERIDATIAPKIDAAVENHFLVPIRPIEQRPELVKPGQEPLNPAPWNDPMDLGPMNLQDAVATCERRWRLGLDIPPIAEFSEVPALFAQLKTSAATLDWSDIKKIRAESEWLWRCAFQGRISDGQWETAAKRLQGVMGEISWRERIVSEYLALPAPPDPAFAPIMILEGQMASADGRMTSDTVLGWLDARTRRLILHKVVEMVVSEAHTAKAREQHEANETRRFPEKGLVIFGSGGSWARVFPEGKAVYETWVLSAERHRDVRENALAILKQLLVWMALKRATATVVPTEKRRQMAGHGEKISVARLLKSVVGGLWRDIAQSRDVRRLDLRLSGLIRTGSDAFAQMLGVYQACLRNVSADLNPTGERKPASDVAAATSVTPPTAAKYQDEAAGALSSLGLPVLDDVLKKRGKLKSARHDAKNQWETAWEGADSSSEVFRKLEAAASPTVTDEIKEQLARYRATLANISASLNPTRQRLGGNEMSRRHKMSVSSYLEFTGDIETRMSAKGWEILSDPGSEQSTITKAARRAHDIIRDSWSKAGSIRELDEALKEGSKKEPEETRVKIEAYRAVLQHMSRDLNASGKRTGLESIAEGTGAAYATLHKYQKDIEEHSDARSWALLPFAKPQASLSRKASEKRDRAVQSSWVGEESVRQVLEKLKRSAAQCADETERRHLSAYVAVLAEMSGDLNPSGVRISSEKLAENLGVSPTLVYALREDVERRLMRLSSPVVADPFAVRSRQAAAAHRCKKIWESIVEKSSDERQMAEALDAEIGASSEPDLQTYLSYYRDTLFNISAALNPDGRRISPFELGGKRDVKQQTMIDYERKVEGILNAKGWKTLARAPRR